MVDNKSSGSETLLAAGVVVVGNMAPDHQRKKAVEMIAEADCMVGMETLEIVQESDSVAVRMNQTMSPAADLHLPLAA